MIRILHDVHSYNSVHANIYHLDAVSWEADIVPAAKFRGEPSASFS